MGDTTAHLRKAEHNKNFLNMIQKNDAGPSFIYPDWMITVSFYIALHYVDAKLASLSPSLHPRNHPERHTFVSIYLPPDVAEDYLFLESKSKLARYIPDSERRISSNIVKKCVNLALNRFV
ncbi:MAG: hypothetical protein QW270_00540 [Candidatus Bathyarchaeia archaeon]